jgi:hypothetical protein
MNCTHSNNSVATASQGDNISKRNIYDLKTMPVLESALADSRHGDTSRGSVSEHEIAARWVVYTWLSLSDNDGAAQPRQTR